MMKHANSLTTALALGAALLSSGANAQYRNSGGNYGMAGSNSGNGAVTRYNNANGGYYGNSYYGNGYYGNPFYGGGFYGNPFYDSYYTLGGSNGAYGNVNQAGGYGNNPYASAPYSAYDPTYAAGGYANGNYITGADPNGFYQNGYYDNNGNYVNGGAAPVPVAPNGAAPNPAAPNGVVADGTEGVPVRTTTAARVLPRTSDTLNAYRVKGNKFYIGWSGENSAVSKITFAMLDLNKRAIMTRTVTQPPGNVTFPITTRMVYYQVVVEYVNGTTNTVTSPL